jgi:hypothetical protein
MWPRRGSNFADHVDVYVGMSRALKSRLCEKTTAHCCNSRNHRRRVERYCPSREARPQRRGDYETPSPMPGSQQRFGRCSVVPLSKHETVRGGTDQVANFLAVADCMRSLRAARQSHRKMPAYRSMPHHSRKRVGRTAREHLLSASANPASPCLTVLWLPLGLGTD